MKHLVLALLTLAVITIGCSRRPRPPIEGQLDPYAPRQVMFADKDLARRTAVGQPHATRDEAGLLHITVPIRAATKFQLYVDYRVTFFDDRGNVLNQTGWMTKTLVPNVPDQIRANSMSPQAADFQMDLRFAK